MKPAITLAPNQFIGQQFAAWLGHPEFTAETRWDDIRQCFTIRVKHVTVEFPGDAYRRLRRCPVEDMPNEFEAVLSR
jgi:hypothetical protein